jgi:hypothetical protein
MVMDLLTIHQLITLILQPTRTSVSGFIAGHICGPAGGGEDREASAERDDWTPIVSGGYEECIGAKKHLVLGLLSHICPSQGSNALASG